MSDDQVSAETSPARMRIAVALRLSRLSELGGISDAVVRNREWLYVLRSETRNSLSIEGHFATDVDLEKILGGRKTAPEILNYFRTAQTVYDLALQEHRESEAPKLTHAFLKHIHSELFRGAHEHEARGKFRVAPLVISGAKVKPPPADIEDYVTAFITLAQAELLDPGGILRLARLHALFESIHPFADGNGRVGRILLNYLAIAAGYAPLIIKGLTEKDRKAYYAALEAADRGFHGGFPAATPDALGAGLDSGDPRPLETLLSAAASESLDQVLLAAAEAQAPLVDLKTMAEQEGVAEATLRKRIERNQLVARRRGKRLVSSPRLYLRDQPPPKWAPTDALPQRREMQAYQPRLHIEFDGLQNVNGRFHVSWIVRNVGYGSACNTKLFLPGITTSTIDKPIEANQPGTRDGTLFEDKVAFTEVLKPYARIIAEFEDHAGNLYRQYGKVAQTRAPSGAFLKYAVESMEKPYLVRSRIVK